MEITYVNQKEKYLTYEHRIEIPDQFTYLNQQEMILKMEITNANHKEMNNLSTKDVANNDKTRKSRFIEFIRSWKNIVGLC